MSYIDTNLMPGESVTYRAKLHWIVFLWPIFWFVVAMALLSGGRQSAGAGEVVILFAILTGIGSFINYTTSEFGITNKRVMVKVGFIKRNSLEVLLTKVEGVQVTQGILGRILGYGTIVVTGTGGSKEPFHKICAPLEFRKKVQEQVAIAQTI